ncbi:sperm protein associated with the nucleus on the X chromosome N3-like [Aotus nancymaae]|uniref:sperm protein associated with the nucleus on the X chromosome N3-like n=1 Tax=Aotus nancymaae TaxID=37293 RepID=UPI000B5133A2|nr:sperm protein associated with the nucleus on the X chromosome N3-like [Aotus nancymaae]
MEQPTSSTNGEKMKSPCESKNSENDKTQETLNRVLASEQSLKRPKKSEHPMILVFYYGKDEKINSNQLENDQSWENSMDPIQEKEDENPNSSKGSSQEDKDLDSFEGPSQEDEDLDS